MDNKKNIEIKLKLEDLKRIGDRTFEDEMGNTIFDCCNGHDYFFLRAILKANGYKILEEGSDEMGDIRFFTNLPWHVYASL